MSFSRLENFVHSTAMLRFCQDRFCNCCFDRTDLHSWVLVHQYFLRAQLLLELTLLPYWFDCQFCLSIVLPDHLNSPLRSTFSRHLFWPFLLFPLVVLFPISFSTGCDGLLPADAFLFCGAMWWSVVLPAFCSWNWNALHYMKFSIMINVKVRTALIVSNGCAFS